MLIGRDMRENGAIAWYTLSMMNTPIAASLSRLCRCVIYLRSGHVPDQIYCLSLIMRSIRVA
jgi:hypothetical protein